jgi:energy-coupling factor transport system permease protein
MVFTLGLTLRHISTFSDEYITIKEAQTSRGLELDKGFLIKRIRNYIPVLIPLLIRSIENAERLSLAMDLKLFSFDKKPSGIGMVLDKYNKLMLTLFLVLFFVALYLIWM